METEVLLLGELRLRKENDEVFFPLDEQTQKDMIKLKTALKEFREEKGFGRGIAAPQIGINKKFISLNLGEGSFCLFNPEVTERSNETFLMWDDCMSFPDLVVKVRRHSSITIRYRNEEGHEKTWKVDDRSHSELLQHEIDHLNGIMATDRAIDKESILYKSVYLEKKAYFQEML